MAPMAPQLAMRGNDRSRRERLRSVIMRTMAKTAPLTAPHKTHMRRNRKNQSGGQ